MTDSSESGSPDALMLELFCSEVETQVTLLSEGLLALEHAPQNGSSLEALMRAAHSIKGAARIVQLDAVVELAHAVEDCFVAAQEGRLLLVGETLEELLHGADQLAFLAELRATEMAAWLSAHEAKMREAAVGLRALLQGGPGVAPGTPPRAEQVAVTPSPAPTPLPLSSSPPVPSQPVDKTRPVRVTAESLSRLLGLAEESMVAARWLQPLASSLLRLQRSQRELSEALIRAQEF